MSDKTFAAEQTNKKINETVNDSENADLAIDKAVIGTVAAFTALIGIWAISCLVSAMYHAGGPVELIKGWFRAVTGV